MKFPPLEWIFFDLDGTLWDHEGASARAVTDICETYGIAVSDFLPIYRKANEEAWRERQTANVPVHVMRVRRFAMALERMGGCSHIDAAVLSEHYLRKYVEVPSLLPGAREAVRAAAAVARVAVITNGFADTQQVKLTHLDDEAAQISFMVCANEQVGMKPQLPIFEATLALAGNPAPAGVLMVGDTWGEDVVPPLSLGWHAAWISHGRPAPASEPRAAILPTVEALSGLLSTGQLTGA